MTTQAILSLIDDGYGEFFDPLAAPSRKKRQTRKQRKASTAAQNSTNCPNTSLYLKTQSPLTTNQERLFDSYHSGRNIVNLGVAGTGKTFVSMYLALKDVLHGADDKKKLVIVRSAVQGRAQGFMPGGPKEKMAMYENPYKSTCSKFFGRGDAYEVLKKRGMIDFESTSFLRGETFENAIIIFDEMQNASMEELQTVFTRIGKNSRIIMCGDFGQNDLIFSKYDVSGLDKFMRVVKRMRAIDTIEYGIDDIVRSGIVRDYYVALAKEEGYVSTKTSGN